MGARSPFPKQEPRRSPEKLALSPEASEFHKLPIKMLMILRPQPPGRYWGGGAGEGFCYGKSDHISGSQSAC